MTLSAIASRYSAAAFTWRGANVTLADGDLPSPLVKSLAVAFDGTTIVTDPASDRLSVAFTTKTGLFQGNFVHPSLGTAITIRGVVYQLLNIGAGVFTSNPASGSVDIAER